MDEGYVRREDKQLQLIESTKNERVKAWKKLHTKKGRQKARAFLIEGDHLIEEALKEKQRIATIIIDEKRKHVPFDIQAIPVVKVTHRVFQEISETDTPQGIIAVCHMPEEHEMKLNKGKYLLVDEVQDPGNVGTLIRTADSAGFDAVILGKGCADRYNAKTIRATQGSLFHLPVYEGDLEKMVSMLQKNNLKVFGTALQGAKEYRTLEKQEAFGLIVGNEGSGVRESLLALCDENVYIPIFGKAESLNVAVAAGILMYSLQQ